jgi:hypothetical protein
MRPLLDTHERPRRWRRPALEILEGRALLSSHPLGPPFPGHHYPAPGVEQFVPLLFPPGTPQPTPQEVERESFRAKAVGTYTVGPGRFADQALTIKGGGKAATSNFSFAARFQFIIFEPKDPTQPVTGVIHYLPANFLQSGGGIILDFSSPTGTEVNGLPTHLNWRHDGASGVPFVGAGTLPIFSGTEPIPETDKTTPSTIVDFNLGAGVTTLKYIPDAHPVPGTMGSGKVIIVTKGLLNAPPNNPIDKNYE